MPTWKCLRLSDVAHLQTGRSRHNGFALPMVLAVTMMLFLLLTAAVSSFADNRDDTMWQWEMTQAQYAAETGITRIQLMLAERRTVRGTLSFTWDGTKVRVRAQPGPTGYWNVTAVGERRYGIVQTVRAVLENRRWTIVRWER
ncbi:hypothetical protein [Polycladomyces subterraneus]|uniref:Uncharacterized protein n=1 Tax=Polycladomyces subterraneus TaxID=1016997 RepID=A0ABT8IQW0_9BACL|nr:hypothetical protein [Polycladomyces subterraneus]MDN4594886.1 hypothetical protein [Polycladomyces subterraneus]